MKTSEEASQEGAPIAALGRPAPHLLVVKTRLSPG